MTIAEQLHFSILSAPVAAANRRALSQAWYSALYRARAKNSPSEPPALAGGARTGHAIKLSGKFAHAEAFTPPPRPRQITGLAPFAMPVERRAPQLHLSRQIEYLVRCRESKRTAATFVLDGTRARVRVLVVSAGGTVRLIAICSKRVRDSVANALDQARYACAARGIIVRAATQEDVRC